MAILDMNKIMCLINCFCRKEPSKEEEKIPRSNEFAGSPLQLCRDVLVPYHLAPKDTSALK